MENKIGFLFHLYSSQKRRFSEFGTKGNMTFLVLISLWFKIGEKLCQYKRELNRAENNEKLIN